jgi:hypothetical protein
MTMATSVLFFVITYYPSRSEILLGAPIAALSCGQSVSTFILISAVIRPSIGVVEVIACLVLLLLIVHLQLRRPIKVIEHEVHIGFLLYLQMILDRLITMDLYFYMGICLAGYSSGLMEVGIILLCEVRATVIIESPPTHVSGIYRSSCRGLEGLYLLLVRLINPLIRMKSVLEV